MAVDLTAFRHTAIEELSRCDRLFIAVAIRDMAARVQRNARKRRDHPGECVAAEVKVRASARIGELLLAMGDQ